PVIADWSPTNEESMPTFAQPAASQAYMTRISLVGAVVPKVRSDARVGLIARGVSDEWHRLSNPFRRRFRDTSAARPRARRASTGRAPADRRPGPATLRDRQGDRRAWAAPRPWPRILRPVERGPQPELWLGQSTLGAYRPA